jgi:L-alanine-DL-glutamate epimerase-like enolase superfamily enzyme
MMLILGVARRAVDSDAHIKQGGWWPKDGPRMVDLAGKSVLVVGYGRIGSRVAAYARAFHMKVIPHASIGIGIYQAASLHATAALPNAPMHEYQHSVFDRNLRYVDTSMRCEQGFFTLPQGPGLGIAPNASVWQFLRSKIKS